MNMHELPLSIRSSRKEDTYTAQWILDHEEYFLL